MIQDILVAVIILASIAAIAYSVFRSLYPGNAPGKSCGGCSGCDLKNMRKGC